SCLRTDRGYGCTGEALPDLRQRRIRPCPSNRLAGIEEEAMTYYGGKEMAAAFRTVRKNTVQIAEEIPENQFDFKPAPEARSVAQTLSHVAIAPRFYTYVHSNKITDMATVNFQEVFAPIAAEEGKPRSKAEIVELLKSEGEKFASFLEGMSEADLS